MSDHRLSIMDVQRKDNYIAALEATVERLRVCGNCGHHTPWCRGCTESHHGRGYLTAASHDPCHFVPSRWTERSTT